MDPFPIPDYLSPIVAYRTWQLSLDGLFSLNCTEWTPGERFEAECKNGYDDYAGLDHAVPAEGCTCGVYAAKNFQHLIDIGYLGHGGVHGEVYLWGRIVECELGWRAQFAYPKNLVVPLNEIPCQLTKMETHLMPLLVYNVDIFVYRSDFNPEKLQNILLWSKATQNYTPEGIDFLVASRKKWYEYSILKKTVKVGDRISVLDVGIGLVEKIEEVGNHVDAVIINLFNRTKLAVALEGIVWNEQNYRWETEGKGYYRTP